MSTEPPRFRYASTMGERYAMPMYFCTRKAAEDHKQRCDKILSGLPGQESMQIEQWLDGQWVAAGSPQ